MRNTSIKILCILCLAALCLSLTACSKHTLRIDMNNVEKVTLYEGEISIKYLENQKGGIELSARDMTEFVELYNNAGYRGLELDYGTTSQWGCVISLRNGQIIQLSAQCRFLGGLLPERNPHRRRLLYPKQSSGLFSNQLYRSVFLSNAQSSFLFRFSIYISIHTPADCAWKLMDFPPGKKTCQRMFFCLHRWCRPPSSNPCFYIKNKDTQKRVFIFWWARRDLNPHVRSEH